MRLFIGISLDAAALRALKEGTSKMRRIADGKYVDPAMYHITLAFLGEINETRIADVKAAMDQAAKTARRTMLALAGAGSFGRADHAILYAGVRGAENLHTAADTLRHALTARDLPFDPKPFKAHITLARRVCTSKELLDVAIEPVGFEANGLTLYHSHRINGVLKYLPIYVSPFEEEAL